MIITRELNLNKPTVLIAILGERVPVYYAEQLIYGVEEEGCLVEIYEAYEESDVRFSAGGVTVFLADKQMEMFCQNVKNNRPILAISTQEAREDIFRTFGKNAARYLKRKKLVEL